MKLSDYIVSFLEKQGVKDVFMISGGLAMHLNDSFGRAKKIKYYCNFHEQAAAMAAEGYAKVKRDLAVCVVTGGPGGSNTITGVVGQWQDSVPVLYISGQVRTDLSSDGTKLRQLGEQELNIVDLIKPITKYAVRITDPKSIKYHLEKAYFLAKSGRPGPVWLDIPLDVQAAIIDIDKLKGFDPKEFKIKKDIPQLKKAVADTIKLILKSKRPVVLAGSGIQISDSVKEFLKLADLLKIPVVAASCANDVMYADNKYYFGNPGLIGDRASNFVIQNSDLLISIGSRLNFKTISFNTEAFAREAKLVVVDIDENELDKNSINPFIKVHADAKDFINEMLNQIKTVKIKKYNWWLDKCREWRRKFPLLLPQYEKNGEKYVNPYYFNHILSDFFKEGDIVVTCNGITALGTFLMSNLKKNQRLIANIGCGSMGYDLPAAIGACIANDRKMVVLTVGDGSIQFNIQELQTIVNYKLPIKIFVYNNGGYLSIRNTQNAFFDGRHFASGKDSGIICPDITKVAKAYGIPSVVIKNHKELKRKIKKVYSVKGPILCDVRMPYEIEVLPKMGSKILPNGKMVSRPMEDMYPYLSEEELKNNMIIKPLI